MTKLAYEGISAVFGHACAPTQTPTVTDTAAVEFSERLATLIDMKSAIEAEIEQLKDVLKSYVSDEKTIIGNMKIVQLMRKGAVDYSAIPELKAVDLEGYRKAAIKVWVFSDIRK